MKEIIKKIILYMGEYYSKIKLFLNNENKFILISNIIQIFILLFILLLLIQVSNSYLKLFLSFLMIILIIIFRKFYKILVKEIVKLEKEKIRYYSLYYIFLSLIISNISMFIYFWLYLYLLNNNDILGLNEVIKLIFIYINANVFFLFIRIFIVFLTIFVFFTIVKPRFIKKHKENIIWTEKEMELINKKLKPFLESRLILYKFYLQNDNYMIILLLFSPIIFDFVKNIFWFYIIILLFYFILIIFIVFNIVYDIFIFIKLRIMIYNFFYKPNPGPSWIEYFEFLKKFNKAGKDIVYYYNSSSLKKHLKITIVLVGFINTFYFGGYYWWNHMYGDEFQYPPQKKLRKFGKWVYDTTGFPKDLPENHEFKKSKQKD